MAISSKKTRNVPQPKVDESCLRLTQLAHRLGADAQLPRLADLKNELGVSLSTLDIALTRLEERDVIYRRHGYGVFVSPSVQPVVTLICNPALLRSGEQSAFWDILIEAAWVRATSHNELFEMHFSQPLDQPNGAKARPLQQGLMRDLQERRVSGVIGVGLAPEVGAWIESQEVPFVHLFGPGSHAVLLDKEQLVEQGVRVLAERGCRRIGLWHAIAPYQSHQESAGEVYVESFERELRRLGLEFSPARVEACDELLSPPDYQHNVGALRQGQTLARRVFSRPRAGWPDGVLIVEDQLTRGALAEIERLGVQPARDVVIASHANRNSPTLDGFDLRLHLIEVDPQEMVNTAFATLEILMNGGQAPQYQTVQTRSAPNALESPNSL